MAKNNTDGFPKLGKIPQKRNRKLDPNDRFYDPELAKRRRKEKMRRKANTIRRQRGA